jgi:hypothetical protein
MTPAKPEARQQQSRGVGGTHRAEGEAFRQQRCDNGEEHGGADRDWKGKRHCGCEEHPIACHRHQLAMCKVDQRYDGEHHRQSKCEQRVDAAEADGVDDLLQDDVHGCHSAR